MRVHRHKTGSTQYQEQLCSEKDHTISSTQPQAFRRHAPRHQQLRVPTPRKKNLCMHALHPGHARPVSPSPSEKKCHTNLAFIELTRTTVTPNNSTLRRCVPFLIHTMNTFCRGCRLQGLSGPLSGRTREACPHDPCALTAKQTQNHPNTSSGIAPYWYPDKFQKLIPPQKHQKKHKKPTFSWTNSSAPQQPWLQANSHPTVGHWSCPLSLCP